MNYNEETQETRDRAERASAKAAALTRRRIKEGWRYVRATPNTLVFVECDAQGKPTERGQERLRRYKERFGFTIR